MDFEKKFPLTQSPDKVITVQWTRGYNHIQVLYSGKVIGEHIGAKDLKKGILFQTEHVGNFEVKLGGDPLRLNVIVDGLHSPANSMHPKHAVKGIATYFWILFGGGLLVSLLEVWQIGLDNPIGLFMSVFDALILTLYLLAAILLGKGKSGAFYLGFVPFCFTTLLVLLLVLTGNFIAIVSLIIRAIYIVYLSKSITHLNSLSRHNQYGSFTNSELLDSKL
jgi:hypothetical protein